MKDLLSRQQQSLMYFGSNAYWIPESLCIRKGEILVPRHETAYREEDNKVFNLSGVQQTGRSGGTPRA